MGRRYAEGTSVSADKTRLDMERALRRLGAADMMVGSTGGREGIQFAYRGKSYRFAFDAPTPDRAPKVKVNQHGTLRDRTAEEAFNWSEGERDRLWRALALLMKAKTVAVDEGLYTFEEAFMAERVTTSGMTVTEVVAAMDAAGKPLALGTGK